MSKINTEVGRDFPKDNSIITQALMNIKGFLRLKKAGNIHTHVNVWTYT